jgi:hypothetical protein
MLHICGRSLEGSGLTIKDDTRISMLDEFITSIPTVHICLDSVGYTSIHLWLLSPLLDLGRFFSFLILYTVGGTPWTGDQPDARLLPTHRTAQTQNKRTQRPRRSSSGWSLASRLCGPGSIPGLVKWDLWWTKWRWGRFSPSASVPPANLHSTNCSIITLTYRLGLAAP